MHEAPKLYSRMSRILRTSLPLIAGRVDWGSVFRADHENIDELQRRVKQGVSKLKGLDLGDELGVEILSQLVEGRKSASEIVELIYGLRRGDEGHKSCHGRVSREIRRLESKGLVSRVLFGREKPYRLTELAVINLARIGGHEKQVPIVPMVDVVMYISTVGSAVPLVLLVTGWIQLSQIVAGGLSCWFCLLLGVSLTRFAQAFRRVF
jgi:hypothetical protein